MSEASEIRGSSEAAPLLRVLVADDHPMFRDGVRAMLLSAPDMEYAGEAESGEEAACLAAEIRPHVVVMDIQMPGGGGIEATRRIKDERPETNVLMVTMFEDDATVFAAMRAGASGYILKGANYDEMLRAIKAAGNGEAIFSPKLALRLVDFFSGAARNPPPEAFPELSERERETLDLIARGLKNQEIAKQLYLSPKTVRNNVSSILHKLHAADRAEAIIRAREAGMG